MMYLLTYTTTSILYGKFPSYPERGRLFKYGCFRYLADDISLIKTPYFKATVMKKFFKIGRRKSLTPEPSPQPKRAALGGGGAHVAGYEIRDKDLSNKLHKAAWNGDIPKVRQLAKKDANPLDKENRSQFIIKLSLIFITRKINFVLFISFESFCGLACKVRHVYI